MRLLYTLTLLLFVACYAHAQAPINDDVCAADILFSGGCVSGTTENATPDNEDASNPACAGAWSNSVWYTITLTGNNTSLEIDLSTNTFPGGSANILVYEIVGGCTGTSVAYSESYCGPVGAPVLFEDMTPGSTYHIQISTSNADFGTFDICATEVGPPPGCSANMFCDPASGFGPQSIALSAGSQVCVPGCNAASVGGPNFGAGDCFDFLAATVWYTFNSGTNNILNISVAGIDANFTNPQVALFQTTDCFTYIQVACVTGSASLAEINFINIGTGQDYVIAISEGTGEEGNFDLCLTADFLTASCNTTGTLTENSSTLPATPVDGPYLPGEQVEFCYDVIWDNSGTTNFNWLQGFVPTFGNCWDPASFDAQGQPNIWSITPTNSPTGTGSWGWYPDGFMTYSGGSSPILGLDMGDPVGAGWFFHNTGAGPAGPDPSSSWGNSASVFELCFTLTARLDCQDNTDCAVSIKTYADGEVGGWTSFNCNGDLPTAINPSLNCCIPPDLDPLASVTICSGSSFTLPLSSPQDPFVAYTWTPSPSAYGATSGTGSIISQTLTNTTGASAFVTYTINGDFNGCPSLQPQTVTIEVLPEVSIDIPPAPTLCQGSTFELCANISGGSGVYDATWGGPFITGPTNPDGSCVNIDFSNAPTGNNFYTLTVFDDQGCFNSELSTIQVVPNNESVEIQTPVLGQTEYCQTAFPITLSNTNSTAITYTWTTASGGTILGGSTGTTVSVNSPGEYILVVEGFFCDATDTIEITEALPPVADIATPGQITCSSSTVSLDATGSTGAGLSYTWDGPAGSNIVGDNTATPSVDMLGTYNVTITSSSGCTDTDQITITGNTTAPTAEAGTAADITCLASSVTLDASSSTGGPNLSYQWSGGLGSTASVSTNTAGNYTVTITNLDNGCTDTDNVTVGTDLAQPTAFAGQDQELTCATTSVTLDASGSSGATNLSYQWSGGLGNTASVNATVPNTYTVTVTNTDNGCTNTDEVEVTQDIIAPTAEAGTAAQLTCSITSITLDASSSSGGTNLSYDWSDNLGTTASVSASAPNTYTVTVTNPDNGCTDTDDVTVNQDITAPTAEAGTGGQLTCAANTFQLDGAGSATGGNITYQWGSPNGGSIQSGETTLMPIVNGAGDFVITVTNTDNGCTDTDDVTVTQDPSVPVADAGNDQDITCAVSQVNISGSGSTGNGLDYTWSTTTGTITPGTENDVSLTITDPGVYNLEIEDQNGCVSNSSVTVNDLTALPGADAGTDQEINCNATSVTLDGSNSDSGTDITYIWSNSLGGMSTATANVSGTYYLTVTNTATSCLAIDTVEVTENTTAPVADAGVDSVITCTNPQINLDASGSDSGPGISLEWSDNLGNSVNPTIISSGTYTITVTNSANGCTDTDDVIIGEDFAAPTADAGTDVVLTCDSTQVTLDGTGSSSGSNIAYAWNVNSATTNTTVVNNVGIYTVTVTNSDNGCTDTDDVEVTENITPPTANAGVDDILTCTVTSLQLNGSLSSSGANISYQWSGLGGGMATPPDAVDPTISQADSYVIVVTDADNGCTAMDTVMVSQDANLPMAEAGDSLRITCTNSSVILDGTGSTTGNDISYSWSGAGGGSLTNSTTLMPTANEPDVYTLTVTNTLNSCSATDVVVVTIDTISPMASANAGMDILLNCASPTAVLDGSASSAGTNITYQWTSLPAGAISAPNDAMMSPTIDMPANYILTVQNVDNGCIDVDNVNVTENFTTPTAEAGPDRFLTCADSTVMLDGTGSSAGGDITYFWDGPSIILGQESLQSPLVGGAGMYYITVTNTASQCIEVDSVLVLQDNNIPIANAGQDDSLTCSIISVMLNGTFSSSGPSLEYSWSGPGTITDPTTLTPTVDAPGVYTLVVRDTSNNCQSQSNVTITLNDIAPVANAGMDDTLTCTVTSIVLDASNSTGVGTLAYDWGLSSGADPTFLVGAPGNYTVTVTNTANGCTDTDIVAIASDPSVPIADVGPPDTTLNCFVNAIVLGGPNISTGPNITYEWDNNLPAVANPTVTAAGTYNLTVTNTGNSCTATSLIIVNQDTISPPANAGADDVLNCTVTDITLGNGPSPDPSFNYLWDSGLNPEAEPVINTPGTYSVTVTNTMNFCTSTDQVTITQDTLHPIADAGMDVTLTCDIQSLTLGGPNMSTGPNITYNWDNSLPAIANPSVSTAGVYTVTVTNTDNGCTNTDVIDVIPDANLPTADAGATTNLTCLVTEAVLDGTLSSSSPNIYYEWTGGSLSGGITTSPTVTVTEPGLYTIMVVDSTNNCTQTDTITITQDIADPVANAGAGGQITCTDTTVTLNAGGSTGNGTLNFDWGNGSSADPTITVNNPGLYTVTVTDIDNGCVSTDTVSVTVDADTPVSDAGSDSTLTCDVLNIQLGGGTTSTGLNYSYSWQGGNLTGNTTPDPTITEPGVYTLTVLNTSNNCTDISTVTISQDIVEPVVEAGPDGQIDCINMSVDLDPTGTDQGTNFNYEWQGGAIDGSTNLMETVTTGGTFTLVVTNTDNGCTNTDIVTVTENIDEPSVDIVPPSDITCDDETSILNASGSENGVNFAWATNSGSIVTGADSAFLVVDGAGIYTLVITNPANGCTNTAIEVVEDNTNAPTNALLTINNPPCSDGTGSILVDTVIGGVGPFAYSVDGGAFQTSPFLTALTEGSHDITVQSLENGCTYTTSGSIDIPAELQVFLPDDITIHLGDSTNFVAVPSRAIDSLFWSAEDYLEDCIQNCLGLEVGPLQTTTYTITVIDDNGCIAEDQIVVRVENDINVFVPNIFTPNGDGENDILQIFAGKGVEKFNTFRVFNRWGEMVFTQDNFFPNDPGVIWDGRFNGKQLNPGVFVFFLEVQFVDGSTKILKGDITLVYQNSIRIS